MAPEAPTRCAQHTRSPFIQHLRRTTAPFAASVCVATITTLGAAGSAFANEAAVVSAKATCDSARVCSFDVTVRHDDTGWDHYANAWRIIAVDGAAADTELGRRVLHHPHENEQPFTRSLSGVSIPDDTTQVEIEALDSVHEGGGPRFRLTIDQ